MEHYSLPVINIHFRQPRRSFALLVPKQMREYQRIYEQKCSTLHRDFASQSNLGDIYLKRYKHDIDYIVKTLNVLSYMLQMTMSHRSLKKHLQYRCIENTITKLFHSKGLCTLSVRDQSKASSSWSKPSYHQSLS